MSGERTYPLRDYFAGIVLGAIWQRGGFPADLTMQDIAEKAYRQAEQMVRAREAADAPADIAIMGPHD